MVDITESSLFNPTAPPETLIFKSAPSLKFRRHQPIFPSSGTMESRWRHEDTGTLLSEVQEIPSDQMNTNSKTHPSSENRRNFNKTLKSMVADHRNVIDPSSTGIVSQGDAQTVDCSHSAQDQAHGRNYSHKKTSINVLFKLYLAMKAKLIGDPESDEDELVGEDIYNEIGPQRANLKPKNPFLVLSRKQKASCKIAFQNTKRMMGAKSKSMTKSFKRTCLEWAYGVGNANAFLFAQSGLVSMNEFYPCNSSVSNNQINV